MKIDELKPGDVLLFSGDKESFISKAIMYLTDAPVSHAALSYTTSDEIVEEVPPAVCVSDAEESFEGRDIYVMRPENMATGGVVEAAAQYLNDEEPYPDSNLYMVGLILIYRKIMPGRILQKAIIKILRKLTSGIIDFINKRKYAGKTPMVCSQFVYQCYKDAGHKLNIKGGVILEAAVPGGSILDQVTERIRTDAAYREETLLSAGQPSGFEEMPVQSDEELARELMDALEGAEEGPAELERDFVMSVHEFSHAVYMHQTGAAETLTAPAHSTEGLELLKENEAYFVTPGDLLKYCEDLKQKGMIKID